jgi:glucose uptake protein
MRYPIEGSRLTFRDYLKGSAWVHLLGIIGGMIWIVGSLSNFVAASAPKALQVGPAISYAIGQGSTMVGALWGVLAWKEFAGGGVRVNRLLFFMFMFYLIGLVLVSIAPLYAIN